MLGGARLSARRTHGQVHGEGVSFAREGQGLQDRGCHTSKRVSERTFFVTNGTILVEYTSAASSVSQSTFMAYNSSFALGIDITIRLARCSGVSAFCKRSMTPHTCERRRESRGAVTARREKGVVGAARAGLGWAAFCFAHLGVASVDGLRGSLCCTPVSFRRTHTTTMASNSTPIIRAQRQSTACGGAGMGQAAAP